MTLDPDLDNRVRQALDPDTRTVDRMVVTALRRRRHSGARLLTPWRLGVAAAVILFCALWMGRQPALVQPPADLVLTRAGDVVMIQSASGETLILGPRRPGGTRGPGSGFVIVEGGVT